MKNLERPRLVPDHLKTKKIYVTIQLKIAFPNKICPLSIKTEHRK